MTGLVATRVEWQKDPATGRLQMVEVPGSEWEMPADLVLLAMGFVHPVHQGLLDALAVARDSRGNVEAATEGESAYQTLDCQGVQRGRYAPGAITGGVGHSRRPAMRSRGR